MKRRIKTSFLLPAFVVCLGRVLAWQATGQTFTTLHTFTKLKPDPASPFDTNSDGAVPNGDLVLSGNTLYGTAQDGGAAGFGTIFSLKTDGTGFTNLHSFVGGNDGANPAAGLILSGNTLYGSTIGGNTRNGTIFALNVDGSGFTNLYSFTTRINGTNSDGAWPTGLILSADTLYGGARFGGLSGAGTVFALNTNGTDFRTLRSFVEGGDGGSPNNLILAGNTLFGTTHVQPGGPFSGTVFSLKTDGSGFTTLHSFPDLSPYGVGPGGLTLSGNVLYGTLWFVGYSGTIFSLNTDGTGFTSLYNFSAAYRGYNGFSLTNSDGVDPNGIIRSGDSLYGTAGQGGPLGYGTVFKLGTNGVGFSLLHSFTAPPLNIIITNSDGATPTPNIVVSGNTLYGTANRGGSSGEGTVFSITLPIPLTITCSAPLLLECTNGGALGTLEVDLKDSSGAPVVVTWAVDGASYQTNIVSLRDALTTTNLTFTANFGFGEHLVTVTASNGQTNPATCSTTVHVRDTTPPQILSLAATPDLLWPPNHQMVPVTIEVQAMDNCGPTASKIVAVTSNEPTDAAGSQNGDWLITDNLTLALRAERLGDAHGRIYTILIECDDIAGNASFGSVTVEVPHDHGRAVAR